MPPSSSSSPSSSLVEMEDYDAGLVGKHCEHDYCNQLDFLPFLCQSCAKTFCLSHRTESAHACARAGAWAERRRLRELGRTSIGAGREAAGAGKKPCAGKGCHRSVGTALAPAVHCAGCNRDYCLQHRLLEDHDCKNLIPVGARPAGGASGSSSGADADMTQRARGALDRLRAWGAARRAGMPASSSAAAGSRSRSAAASLATMRREASGDDKIAAEKRVYLHVEAEAGSTTAKVPRGVFFYSRDWVVGRVLDAAARSLQIENVNNQSEDETNRLRVFHVEGGRLLEFSEKLGQVVASGNTMVLLRGVGPPPELIDL